MAMQYYDLDLEPDSVTAAAVNTFVATLRSLLWDEVLAKDMTPDNQYRFCIGKKVVYNDVEYILGCGVGNDYADGSSSTCYIFTTPVDMGNYNKTDALQNTTRLYNTTNPHNFLTDGTYCKYWRFYKDDQCIYVCRSNVKVNRDAGGCPLSFMIIRMPDNYINILSAITGTAYNLNATVLMGIGNQGNMNMRGVNARYPTAYWDNDSLIQNSSGSTRNISSEYNFMYRKCKNRVYTFKSDYTPTSTSGYKFIAEPTEYEYNALLCGYPNNNTMQVGTHIELGGKTYVCVAKPENAYQEVTASSPTYPGLFLEKGTAGTLPS